jgi:hypothetical protein
MHELTVCVHRRPPSRVRSSLPALCRARLIPKFHRSLVPTHTLVAVVEAVAARRLRPPRDNRILRSVIGPQHHDSCQQFPVKRFRQLGSLGPDGPNRPTNRFATGIALVLRTDAFEERDGTEETVRQHMGVGGRVMLANTR